MRRLHDHPWLWAVPGVGAFCGVATIAAVYFTTATNDHLPAGVATPPISFLGAQEPEHTVYQLGFALTGVLLAACMYIHGVVIEPLLVEAGFTNCAFAGKIGGWAACVGATGQGLITLQEDILDVVQGKAEPDLQSIVHQLIAAFFFLGAAAHCYGFVYALVACDSGAKLHSFVSPASKAVKCLVCATTLLASPIAQLLHPAARANLDQTTGNMQFEIAGMAQYITVGLYITFFGCYSYDLYFYNPTKAGAQSSPPAKASHSD